MKYTKQSIGVELTDETLLQYADETRGGSFAVITGYTRSGDEKNSPLVAGQVEVASYVLNFGINYKKLKADSITILENWAKGEKLPAFTILTVKRGDVVGGKKITVTQNYKWTDEIVMAAIKEILSDWKNPPEKKGAEYEKAAKSIYTLNGEIYLRDVLVVSKIVTQKAEYRHKKSSEMTAIKDFIRRLLPVGNYRQFCLNDKIEGTLSFGGHKMLIEEGIVLETLPELLMTYLSELSLSGQVKVGEEVALGKALTDLVTVGEATE